MPRLEVQVGSLQWHRQCSSLSRRRLDGSFSLEGVLCAVCVSTDSRGGASHSSATGLEATDLKRIVLRRWNCRMRMQWSPLGDEGTRQPWLALSIQAGPVLLAADRSDVIPDLAGGLEHGLQAGERPVLVAAV